MENELAGYGYLEITGVVFALLYVLLAIKERRSCWIAAIISSAAYVPTFYLSRLYTEAILQFFFIAVAAYGWYQWRENQKGQGTVNLKISTWPPLNHIKAIILSLIISYLIGYLLKNYSNASFPFIDAGITIFSITVSYMQAKKIIENWAYWMLIDAIATAVYVKKRLFLTACLYALYVLLAAAGLREWQFLIRKEKTL